MTCRYPCWTCQDGPCPGWRAVPSIPPNSRTPAFATHLLNAARPSAFLQQCVRSTRGGEYGRPTAKLMLSPDGSPGCSSTAKRGSLRVERIWPKDPKRKGPSIRRAGDRWPSSHPPSLGRVSCHSPAEWPNWRPDRQRLDLVQLHRLGDIIVHSRGETKIPVALHVALAVSAGDHLGLAGHPKPRRWRISPHFAPRAHPSPASADHIEHQISRASSPSQAITFQTVDHQGRPRVKPRRSRRMPTATF